MAEPTIYLAPIILVALLILVMASVRILHEYERAVVFTLGRFAATMLSGIPAAMQLRYLQTFTEIGAERNSTIVFPMPIDIVKPFLSLLETAADAKPSGDARPKARRGPAVLVAAPVPELA